MPENVDTIAPHYGARRSGLHNYKAKLENPIPKVVNHLQKRYPNGMFKVQMFLQEHPDVVPALPAIGLVISGYRMLRDFSPAKLIAFASSAYSVRTGLKFASEVKARNRQKVALLKQLNDPSSELGQHFRRAIEEAKKSQPQ